MHRFSLLATTAALALGLAGQSARALETAVLEPQQISDAVTRIAEAVERGYVFEDKAVTMKELLLARLEDNSYDETRDFAELADRLTADLQSINGDLHLRVRTLPPPDKVAPKLSAAERRQQERDRSRLRNFGFEKIARLPGNVGYLDLRGFADAGSARPTAVAAMNFLANSDALIFDLRRNGGGSPSMIQLLSSYLFQDRVHLNSFEVRGAPKNQEFWTEEDVVGPKMTSQPVYVLTSSYTFSAAEEFTYNLKNMKRATIVGETTGGGAHPVRTFRLPDHGLGVSIPFGRAINPISKTNWEGTGVTPHVEVAADQALLTAHQAAIAKLLERDDLTTEHRQRLEWTGEGLAAPDLKSKPIDAQFGDRRVFVKDGATYYQRGRRPPSRLVPLAADRFCFDDLEGQRLTIERNANGEPSALIQEYADGRRQVVPAG